MAKTNDVSRPGLGNLAVGKASRWAGNIALTAAVFLGADAGIKYAM